MRQFTIGMLCGTAALLATSCNKPTANQAAGAVNAGGEAAAAAQDYYTVRAGPVPDAKISALSGNFQMLKVSAAQGIPSNQRGGACLIFPAADLGFTKMAAKTCTKNSDCSVKGENELGVYCDGDTNSCWAKPTINNGNNELCNRPITMTASTLNPVPADPPVGKGPIDVRQFKIQAGAKVRVVACLNKLGANPVTTGCASPNGPDRIEVMGPVATVKP